MRLILFFLAISVASADLHVGFYNNTCPRAESIVASVVAKRFGSDRTIAAALLRMYFHDCFASGCDASILIDSTPETGSEKDTGADQSVRGYEIIDAAKKRLEEECPSTVSCADVIALATRDAVALAGGLRYAVPTGRRDALGPKVDDANELPGPSAPIHEILRRFKVKGLSAEDVVILLGAHTVGVASCGFFQNRLSDFNGTSKPDHSMDPALRTRLIKICGSTGAQAASLDQSTPYMVDNEYYKQISAGRGILQIDQALALDKSTASIVVALRKDNAKFLRKFAASLVKLGNLDVLLGYNGEIRKKCRVVNKA